MPFPENTGFTFFLLICHSLKAKMIEKHDRFMYNKRMKKIELPKNVKYIIDTLSKGGFEAFAVGGCVRDTLLGRTPGDWDITTNAKPGDMKGLFRHTVDTGIEHGTVTVLIYPDNTRGVSPDTYEVTTYRIDGNYSDGRHPDSVAFTDDLREDLRRRDFTINAMAYNDTVGIADLYEGQKDLENGIIRCVGDPDERFDEDALRILRAVRFSAQLGFSIEEKTAEAVKRHAKHLDAVSKERIYAEISKLFCAAHPEKASALFTLGLSDHIAPGFSAMKLLPESVNLPAIPVENRYLRYALFFRGCERNAVKNILNALKSDVRTRDNAALLASEIFTPLPASRYELKKFIAGMTIPQFEDLLSLKELLAPTDEYEKVREKEDLKAVKKLFREILRKQEPIYMKDLIVTGSDLTKAGIPEGPELGRILSRMLDDVRKDPVHNSVLYLFAKYAHPEQK